jgi:hypothetical protein
MFVRRKTMGLCRVMIADCDGKWYRNDLTFSTVKAARYYAMSLFWRWTVVTV